MTPNRDSRSASNRLWTALILRGASAWEWRSRTAMYEAGNPPEEGSRGRDQDTILRIATTAVAAGLLEVDQSHPKRPKYRLTARGEAYLDVAFEYEQIAAKLSAMLEPPVKTDEQAA